MSELPQHWTFSTLGEICSKPQYGWTSKASRSGKIKYLRTTDISSGTIQWETVPFCEKVPPDISKYRLSKNDVLVSRAGSVGVSLRVEDILDDAVFASYLIRFNSLDGIPTKYVEFFLKSDLYWRSISEFTAGIAIPNVNASKLASLKIPLAPLNEQRRIVEKLDQLLPKVQACQDRLEKISRLLKRFRQSVLAAACSGRLTEDWRGEHYSEGWKEVTVKDVSDKIDYGYTAKARKETLGIKFLRITDIQNGRVHWESVPTCNIPNSAVERFLLREGDIVFARTGATTGKSFLIQNCPRTIFASYLIRVRPNATINPLFLVYFFQSPVYWVQISDNISGSAQPNCNASKLASLTLSLPTIDEQKEIVRRVEVLFKLADQIETRYQKAKADVDKLTQSILAKAFRGELVPQDPNDEPASVLLERIRVARNQSGAMRKRRKHGSNQSSKTHREKKEIQIGYRHEEEIL